MKNTKKSLRLITGIGLAWIPLLFWNCGDLERTKVSQIERASYLNRDTLAFFLDDYVWVQNSGAEGHRYSEGHRQEIRLFALHGDSSELFDSVDLRNRFSGHGLSFQPPYLNYLVNARNEQVFFVHRHLTNGELQSHDYYHHIKDELPYFNSASWNVRMAPSRKYFSAANFVFNTSDGKPDRNLSLQSGIRIHLFDETTMGYVITQWEDEQERSDTLYYYDRNAGTKEILMSLDRDASISAEYGDSGKVLILTKTKLNNPRAIPFTWSYEYYYMVIDDLLQKTARLNPIPGIPDGYRVSDLSLALNTLVLIPELRADQSSHEILITDFEGKTVRILSP